MANIRKTKSQRLSRRKETLVKKSHEMAKFCDVDVALCLRIRSTGQIVTYKSVDDQSWPPSLEQMQTIYPIPLNLGFKDAEAKFWKVRSLEGETSADGNLDGQ